jgi:hypothetical protein
MNREICCECKAPVGTRSVLVCADCGGVFHFPDQRVHEPGTACGTHLMGMRQVFGADIIPLCLRCDMAIRLRHGIPA